MAQICQSFGDGQTYATEDHYIWWHRLAPTEGSTGIILAHGAGATATYFITDPTSGQIPTVLATSNMMAVIASDLAGTIAWGNSNAPTAMDGTLTTLINTSKVRSDKVVLLGQSMGAATVLNWAYNNPTKVAAIVLHVPAVDLQDIIDNNRLGLGPSVTTAYGGNPPAAYNPAVNTATFAPMPMRIYYSTDDPVCVPAVVTPFGAATGADMVSLGANGHAITGIDLEDMADWIAQYI